MSTTALTTAEDTVVINGHTYQLSPLRCKHLKAIDKVLQERLNKPVAQTQSWEYLSKWAFFIAESIRLATPSQADFDEALLDELTMPDYLATWNKVIILSGIQITKVTSTGEARPVGSTGAQSTAASPVPSDTPTVQ